MHADLVPNRIARVAVFAAALVILGSLVAVGEPRPATAGGCENTAITTWPVASGGNGHRYQAVCPPDFVTSDEASADATAAGGYLVTIMSAEENAFVFDLVDSIALWDPRPSECWTPGPLIGAYEPDGTQEPDGGWLWSTGEALDYENWADGEPNNHEGNDENRALFGSAGCGPALNPAPVWHDIGQYDAAPSYIIEWGPLIQGDVDCDGDVDEADAIYLLEVESGAEGGEQPAPCPDVGEPTGDYPWGDINCDGNVDALDALHLIAFRAGFELEPIGDPCTPIGQPLD